MKPKRLVALLGGQRGVRLWRLAAVGFAVVLLHVQTARRESAARFSPVAVDLARPLFPTAVSVGRPDGSGLQPVTGRHRETLGFVLKTSPQTDDLVGYSGPNNLLVGLNTDGRVVGMELLASGDTENHVQRVRDHARLWANYGQWLPREEVPPAPVVVSGSTLTSLAIAEAMQRRLAGLTSSLRFPDPITLDEVRKWFPSAATFQPDSRLQGWWVVRTSDAEVKGYVVRTAPHADNVRGYRGPTECLVAVAPDRRTLLGVSVRRSYDTPHYVQRVQDDEHYLVQCAEFDVQQWATMDFDAVKLEGVSGATQTSYGIAEGLRRRFGADRQAFLGQVHRGLGNWRIRDWLLLLVVIGAIVMSVHPARGRPWVRRSWQIALVGAYGLLLGDLLSLALLFGWAQHGAAGEIAPGLALLVAAALLMPWATRRQLYCQHLCPHGVLQDWLRLLPLPRRIRVRPLRLRLRWVPGLLLAVAFLLALSGREGELAAWEPFDAWSLGTAAAISAWIAGVGLTISCWVPMAYCRYGCPTGAFLRWIRSRGSADRWGMRDATAALLILVGLGILIFDKPRGSAAPADAPGTQPATRVGGTAFGTTWNLTTRVALADPARIQMQAQEQLDQIERTLSHWHPDSLTAHFNAARTLRPLVMPPEFIELVRTALEVSRDSGGAFDVTVAPLARTLGFGPNPVDEGGATPSVVDEVLDSVGWGKLRVDAEQGTVAKLHPKLEVDLGALLQGYAADHLADWLQGQGFAECLVDVGGELRALGAWEVAVEDPHRPGTPLVRLRLEDAALATSGIYRGSRVDQAGARRAHILDPRTGVSVNNDTVLVAVRAPRAVQADAWATALLVIGGEDAKAMAAAHELSALVVGSRFDDQDIPTDLR